MSDLIRRSEILQLPRYSFGVSMLNAEEYVKVSDVKSIQTARNIDSISVVEELEKQRDIIFQDTDSEIKTVRTNAWDKIDILNQAIEIVKQGSNA